MGEVFLIECFLKNLASGSEMILIFRCRWKPNLSLSIGIRKSLLPKRTIGSQKESRAQETRRNTVPTEEQCPAIIFHQSRRCFCLGYLLKKRPSKNGISADFQQVEQNLQRRYRYLKQSQRYTFPYHIIHTRNSTVYVKILGNVSEDRWVSRYIFYR